MDLTVPGGMGGKESIRKLQKIDPGIKAIATSGCSNDPVMAEFRKYFFCNVIPKPYRIEDLSRVLHKVVTRQLHIHYVKIFTVRLVEWLSSS